jgi:DNA-binding transcriptional ArsR family regulator
MALEPSHLVSRYDRAMSDSHPCRDPNVASTAALLADPARAAMLATLLDGCALPAGELAWAAGITAQTASSHLAKLLDGGLLEVERVGRHRYYRLAGPHVAQAIELLAAIAPVRRKPPTAAARRIRHARFCYDHLAGRLGVAVAEALTRQGLIRTMAGKRVEATESGIAWFAALEIDARGADGVGRPCLDWTERTHHLAGPLGRHLLSALLSRNWLRRHGDSRLIEVTPPGAAEIRRLFGFDPHALGRDEG